jgi:hypothetical protein
MNIEYIGNLEYKIELLNNDSIIIHEDEFKELLLYNLGVNTNTLLNYDEIDDKLEDVIYSIERIKSQIKGEEV